MNRGLFGAMAAGLPSLQAKATDMSALTWQALLGQASSKAGVAVNVDSALQVSTVMACIRVLAEGVAQMPLKVFHEADDESLTPARDVAAYDLLYHRPNDWQSSFEFRETLMYHAGLTGNGYALKNVLRGEVRELLPLAPGTYTEERLPNYGFVLHVHDAYGPVGTFTRDQLFHLRGPSWNSIFGLNALRLAREAIGLAIATEEGHERMHANGAKPGGVLSIDNGLSPQARERIKDALTGYESTQNAYRTLILDKGATFSPMGMTGVDSQHLDTRRFQIEEICRHFRVFPQMVGYADKTATFASAEAFFLAHVIHSIMPWVDRWQGALRRDIFPRRSDLVARLSVKGLLRGDAKSRAEFYASGILNGWLVRNEARRMEDMNPLPGLDAPLTPLNMATAEQQAALAKSVGAAVAAEVKALMGHNGGPPLDPDEIEARLAAKIGRVLSATNETRIVNARDELNAVLSALQA